ncbi:MAG: structural cement protein Gp24 [Aeromonas veronii]
MPLNTTYSISSDQAVAGMVADSRVDLTTVTRIPSVALAAGLLVTKDAAVGKAKLPSAQSDYIIGATRWTPTMVQEDDGTTVYKAGRGAPVVTEGPVWLNGAEAIGEFDLVYGVISGAGKIGWVKKTAGADTTTKPVGRAETKTAASGELVVVNLRPALQNA